MRDYVGQASTIATLGRIIPLAPYLLPYAQTALADGDFLLENAQLSNDELQLYLLGLFRLFSFRPRMFKRFVRPDTVSLLLEHSSRSVRYLAIRILQIYLHGADHWFEQVILRYLGEDAPDAGIDGLWDDRVIDYRFLTLWEEDRFEKVKQLFDQLHSERRAPPAVITKSIPADCFHSSTSLIGGVLLPRTLNRAATTTPASQSFIASEAVQSNVQTLANALKSEQPILLRGLPGSGKTSLVRHAAEQLGKLDKMITLHLNEQSDSKLLIGVHTTGDTPGSFIWKPGVLTKAVQEGRWVFIEDLDEIIRSLLPLIERRELFIANRKQTVYAGADFRLIATVKTSINPRGEETTPLDHMLGQDIGTKCQLRCRRMQNGKP